MSNSHFLLSAYLGKGRQGIPGGVLENKEAAEAIGDHEGAAEEGAAP